MILAPIKGSILVFGIIEDTLELLIFLLGTWRLLDMNKNLSEWAFLDFDIF